jgi:hypothetical protein
VPVEPRPLRPLPRRNATAKATSPKNVVVSPKIVLTSEGSGAAVLCIPSASSTKNEFIEAST